MCIINGSPRRVCDTRILAFALDDKLHQVTVYANEVVLDGKPVAMILPFPKGSLQMIDTSENHELFTHLRFHFPFDDSDEDMGFDCDGYSDTEPIPVHTCGSYTYSVAPDLADLRRIHTSFQLEPNVDRLLSTEYSSDYSFLVCIIDKSSKYHPLAYKHRLRGADTDSPVLYLPTKHEHGNGLDADWDHEVYTIGTDFGKSAYPFDRDELVKNLGNKLGPYMPSSLSHEQLRLRTLQGDYPNKDLVIPLKHALVV